MKGFLYFAVELVAKVHDFLLHINDSFELYFSDKQLHFLVMGALGLLVYLVLRKLFAKLPASAAAWLCTLVFMGALALSIEVGQAVTHTGSMELADIAMGMWGVLAFGAAYTVLRLIFKAFGRRSKSS